MEKTKIELSTLNGGMALDMFNEELKKVLANIEDENTNATQHRKVVLTVDFKPDKVKVSISVMTKAENFLLLKIIQNNLTMATAKLWGGVKEWAV